VVLTAAERRTLGAEGVTQVQAAIGATPVGNAVSDLVRRIPVGVVLIVSHGWHGGPVDEESRSAWKVVGGPFPCVSS
jgi:hypothetical protein